MIPEFYFGNGDFLINKTVWMNSENFYLLRLKLRCNEFVFQSMMQTNNKQSEEAFRAGEGDQLR